MGKINVLDSAVFNRIAAGEVVERPASIVKELVENSIDAGATAISIDIENGGIELIRVSDNGSGIAPDDVPTAFMPHATSKIKIVDDLDEIGTLGFRGEALPSIAAVAHVTLASRQADAELGYGIEIENGVIKDQGARGCPLGTAITVRDVFGHIPARKKFLAKPAIEQAEITNIVTRFILADYAVAFKYTVDGKTVFSTDGSDMQKALYAVYGRDVYDNMLPIGREVSGIRLRGYIGKPYFTKHNRTFQTLIVNGRYVINADILYAVYECYADFLMKRQYPVYVLYLQLPHDMVDVNIHPNKLDVKFANLPLVKRAIREAIEAVLTPARQQPQSITLKDEPPQSVTRAVHTPDVPDRPITTQLIKSGMYATPTLHETDRADLFGRTQVAKVISAATASDKPITHNAPLREVSTAVDYTKEDTAVPPILMQTALPAAPDYKIVGCLFKTYIMIETAGVVYLVDQHAAHERLLFERLLKQTETGRVASQPLLIPYTYPLSTSDMALLNERADEIRSLGFDFVPSETALELRAVPSLVSEMDFNSFLPQLLQSLSTESLRTGTLLRDALMQAACKAAVKGDEELSKGELETLVGQLIETDAPLYCPHGRPIAVRLTRKELEKWFKRIV